MNNKNKAAGYEYLLTYKLTTVIYDLTVQFCNCWISLHSRTHDQMVQVFDSEGQSPQAQTRRAARSGRQNIPEGYKQESLKGYIKLTGVARGSQEELLKDFEDYARQNGIAVWAKEKAGAMGEIGEIWKELRKDFPYRPSHPFPLPKDKERAINLMLTLINQTNYMLDRQIGSLEKKFIEEGGFTEKLFLKRLRRREEAGQKSVVNSRKSILVGLAALFFGLIAVGPRPVHAEPARSGIQVSPLSVEREVYPGEEFFFAVQFFNPLEDPQLIRPRFKDLVVEADGQVNFLDYSSPRYTISRWSDFPKEEIPLGPHEERVLQIKVKVPDDAIVGGHFGAIFGEVQAPAGAVSGDKPYQVKQQVAVGVLVFLSVLRDDLGTDVWQGELRDFTLEGKKLGNVFISPEPLSFGAVFDNLGIFHQNVWGGVEITDTQGGRVANLPLRERKILPGVAMSYFEAWRPTHLWGRYKARLRLHYGRNGENTAEKTMSFYVVDQRLILSVALVIVMVTALVVIRRPRLLPPSHNHSAG